MTDTTPDEAAALNALYYSGGEAPLGRLREHRYELPSLRDRGLVSPTGGDQVRITGEGRDALQAYKAAYN